MFWRVNYFSVFYKEFTFSRIYQVFSPTYFVKNFLFCIKPGLAPEHTPTGHPFAQLFMALIACGKVVEILRRSIVIFSCGKI